MNLFNMINCRIVEPKEINIFMSLFNNKWFWIVIFFEILEFNPLLIADQSSLLRPDKLNRS